MLILSYLGEANKFALETGLNLLAVRNPPKNANGKIQIPEHFIHVPQLSPSKQLFSDTQEWKKEHENKQDWWRFYEARFLKEMAQRDDLIRALSRLEARLKNGELVRVFCFCKDVCYCHRSFIGYDMEKKGYEVDFRRLEVKSDANQAEQLTLF